MALGERMPGDRFDYGSERKRHEKFVGRSGLLARLDQLLVDSEPDRWVVITGGPGMGKSALLAEWLARREVSGAAVAHHFIRRGAYDWDDPVKLVGSLVAQLDDSFPDLREPDGDERMHPATRLARALSRVSEKKLRPHGERLVVLIDGLDEYDPPVGSSGGDPLAAFLPDALPTGVRLLCASRPRHPYISSLEARDGMLVEIDLDHVDNATDNDATVRAFWTGAAAPLGLDPGFIDEAVARAGGNVQHAVQLQKHLDVLSPEQRRVEDIPRGLAALIEKSWARIANDAVAVEGLGILCAAREALTLDELGAVAGWAGEAQRRAFVRAAAELLVETLRSGGQPEFRLHHDSIRGYIARAIGDELLRTHHATLAQRHATWPTSLRGAARRYALRHALIHRAEAGDCASAWQLASDISFLETKCRDLGVHETESDVTRMAERCRASADVVLSRRFGDLSRALGRESHWLRAAPEAAAALVWNRLRRSGWSANDLDEQLMVPAEVSFLRVRHAVARENPALVRDLVGHAGWVTACAVTEDGRRMISASEDQTLRLWDLYSGRLCAILERHTGAVLACAVTPDGRRAVSASQDRMLMVWDLESGRALIALEGHNRGVNACTVTADGRRAVSASEDRTLKVWDLETGGVLATMEGHTGAVLACAVTTDGRRVVSASFDRTLKVWDLETGGVLATMEGHNGMVLACAVTKDSRYLVSGSHDRTLKVWDLENGRVLATLQGHTGGVRACAVTADGRRAISASSDRTLKVWDLESGRVLATLEGHTNMVMGCATTVDGQLVVSASADHRLKVWDLDSERVLATLEGDATGVIACAVTVDGRRVVSALEDRTLKIWDLESGRAVTFLPRTGNWLRVYALMADGQRIVLASRDGTLKVWDLESGRAVIIQKGYVDGVTGCAMTTDGRRVISVARDRTLKVWDLENRRALATLYGHIGRVNACVVTTDGRRVVSASRDRTLKVWDVDTGYLVATLRGHADEVRACAVTADSRRVVSASRDRTLKVWDIDTGHLLATLSGHTDLVRACAVTTDGRQVVSASDDRTLKVWDLKTYACLFTHFGDAPYSAIATTTTAIVAGDSAGALWLLDWPASTFGVKRRRASSSNDGQRGSHAAHATPSPRPQAKKHTILFLAANPPGTNQLALDEEARAIQVELERSGHRDQFELVTRWAVQPLDLLRELRKLKPTVVHFSGHGKPGEPRAAEFVRRDVIDDSSPRDGGLKHGLFFQGADGRPQLVSTAALEETFGAAGSSVKLIVLNACYSESQVEALLAHVDCVVGMGGSIGDDAARNFAVGFYGGLGERESVAAAYRQGRAAISLEGLRDSDRPKLKVRDGVDADHLVLAADPQ